jgi:hypothetical protein
MGGTDDPPEMNDDQDDDLKAGEEVRLGLYPFTLIEMFLYCLLSILGLSLYVFNP